jgi:predicted dehydrogenase
MIKIGLMGCGTVAGYGHLPAIVAIDGLQLTALFDPNRAHLDTAGERFGVPPEKRFTNSADFFKEKLDAVSVTSPAPFHYANVMAAAESGCHVLCEKPLAESESDGWKMVEAMKQAKKHLFVGFIYRFTEMAQTVRDVIRAGEIGQLRSIRLVYIWDCHGKYVRETTGSSAVVQASTNTDSQGRKLNLRRDRFMREGGPMIDCGVHQIDLARWWADSEIKNFAAHGAIIDDDYNIPDHVYIHADHANGVHSMIESAFSYGHTAKEPQVQYRFEAIGTTGVICFNRDRQTFTLATPAGTKQFPYHQEKDFAAMYAQFHAAIHSGDPGPFATGEDGIIATKIARAAVESIAATQRPSP